VNSKTVGVILPLSGKYADIGRSVLSSLQLGLGIYDNNSNIRLAVIDSEGKYLDARRAVEKLVVEDRVIAIIGSLQSKSAAAVSSKAQSLGVPTIVLSQKSGLTDIGPFVFRNALTSEMQVEHLVRVAREQMNISKFGILYPEDAYGIEYANLFWTEVEKMGGKVRAAQSYDPKETDFRAPIQRLVGTYYTDDRAIEYKQKLTEWENKKKRTSARHEPPQDLLPPLVDFEALFIPDSAKVLGQVSAMLAVSDVKGITLLGTNLWNTSGLAERAGPFNIIFVDSFYRNDPNFLQSPIVKEFQEKTGKIPTLFDIQAYDTAVVIKNALSSASSRTGLKEELSRLTSVRGALTNLQMLPSRDLSRPIVTLTVKDGQIVLMK
jgi:ABC-type branched-subunit amino acid transport system substrate-binding protein